MFQFPESKRIAKRTTKEIQSSQPNAGETGGTLGEYRNYVYHHVATICFFDMAYITQYGDV